jgi:glycosyltransferase involved in cell wall biosynthesis
LDLEPQIVTVHDMIKFKSPRKFSEKIIRVVEYRPVKSARRVVTVSDASKRDTVDILGIDERKVSTVYPGVREKYRPIDINEDAVRSHYNLPEDDNLVLYLGSEEPRKNVPTAVRACAEARRQGCPVHFVKAGSAGTFGEREATMRAVRDTNMEEATTFLGFVPEEDLPELYNVADVFLFPSRYEGFGLPPLEAMACGTPVITSDRASLPEVVGNAGITTDPDNVDVIADHLVKLLSNESLKKQLRDDGLQRAEQFSWQQTAEQLREIYREVYENHV